MMNKDTLFVIGSNSFSGATFTEFALRKGLEVVGISRSIEPVDAFLPYKWQSTENFRFYHFDLNQDFDKIVEILHEKKPAQIINFAAQSMVAESWQTPIDWFMTNTVSTIKLHDELRKCTWLKRYIHISTPEVYGNCSGFVKEDNILNPSTPYAVSRAAADMSLATFYKAYKFPVISTRAANVYGPGQQLYRIIPRTILSILTGKKLQLHGGGVSTRSFIHMRDVCEATWQIMHRGQLGEIYHIATENVISIHDLVETICQKLAVSFEDHVEIVGERMGKDSAYHLETSKIREQLGWNDQIDFDTGLNECINWVKSEFDVLKKQSFDYQHKP